MDTEKLKHLKVLIQTKNLRKAAEMLNMSHPGLSKSIKSLEVELGIELITKDGRGIRLTEEGLRVGALADYLLLEEEKFFKSISKEQDNIQSTCRIGTFEVFSTYLSSKLAKGLEHLSYISFNELLPGDIETMIASGTIDYGITYLPIPNPHVDHLKITQVEMGIYACETLKKQAIEFSELPFVIPVADIQNVPTKMKGLDGWPDHKIRRKIKYSVSLMETALSLCRNGLAVGYFPNFIIEEHNRVCSPNYHLKKIKSPLPMAEKQDVFLVKRRNSDEDINLKKIAKIIRSLK